MKHIKVFAITSALIIGLMMSCHQSDPPGPKQVDISDPDFGREGNKIKFSGRKWWVKIYEDRQWGPGPNYFSGNEEDITIDNKGHLHMKIVNRNGKWMSTEIVSEDVMGYGTYIFTIDGDIENIPENIVLGLFTWDDETFQTQANSEVDIEFSKWGNANDQRTLQYGVQPINFGTLHPEREYRPQYTLDKLIGTTTHAFTWTKDKIYWASYIGDTYGQGELLAEWTFDQNNPGRVKEENGRRSNPIVIPAPGPNTNCRINFWITPWVNSVPTDGKEQEIVITKFEYRPL